MMAVGGAHGGSEPEKYVHNLELQCPIILHFSLMEPTPQGRADCPVG